MQHSVLTGGLALLCAIAPAAAIWPFPPKHFKENSFVDAGLVGLDPDGRIVAFGDFNGDQL
jgi:integrin alpha FG-GAP repeat containing protein 1